MKLYLIRHGETDWNHLCRFQGREDVPLNAEGIRQGQICGKALAGQKITAIYTSPLVRAMRTGEEIAKEIGLSSEAVTVMSELIERDLGPFSGQFVKDRQEYFALSAGENVPGMEPFDEVLARMRKALELLDEKSRKRGDESIAAVSHGAAINVLLSGLTDHEIGTGKTKLYNGGISMIEGDAASGFQVTLCNAKPEEFQNR